MNYLKLILAISFYMISFRVCSQNIKAVDSLLIIKQNQIDTIKVNTLNELAWELRKNQPRKALDYANSAMKLSVALDYNKGKLISLNRIGAVYIYTKKYDMAQEVYLQLLDEENKIEDDYGVGRACNQLGLVYTQKGDLKKALNYSLKAEEKFELLGKSNIVAITSNNISDLYTRLGDFENAMTFALKSLNLKEKYASQSSIALTLQNIGILDLELGNPESALNHLNRAKSIFLKESDTYELAKSEKNIGVLYLKKGLLDSAELHFNESLKLKKSLKIEDADIYNNLGALHFKKENYKEAIDFYTNALKIEPSSETFTNMGHIYFLEKDYKKAEEFYLSALKVAENSSDKIEIMELRRHISDVNYKQNKFQKAIEYNSNYLELRDSLQKSYIDATNFKINYEEQLRKVAILEKNKVENRNHKLLINALLLVSILMALLFFALYKGNKQRQLKRIAEKNQQIEKQKVEELLQKQELESLNAMMVGQEEERKRIARDLHDRLGSMLAMVKNHFKSVEEDIDHLKTSNVNLYQKANKLLDEACHEVRKISQDIASGTLTKFGLTAALEDLRNTLEESKQIDVEFVSHGFKDRLPLDYEINIYRIFQELISNALKHSEASELSMQVLKSKEIVNIIVEDNGMGFNHELQIDGMGLKNVEARVLGLHGEMKIDSKINQGTTVTIDIPIKEKAYD